MKVFVFTLRAPEKAVMMLIMTFMLDEDDKSVDCLLQIGKIMLMMAMIREITDTDNDADEC